MNYELVIPVELPAGMTPNEFLSHTTVEWARGGHHDAHNPTSYRYTIGGNLETVPRFTGPKTMRKTPPPTKEPR